MNNLRNLAVAAMASGGDNAGRLPTFHPEGQRAPYWLLSREILQTNGIYKESCYAPSRNIYGGAPDYDWWYNYGHPPPPIMSILPTMPRSKRTHGFSKAK